MSLIFRDITNTSRPVSTFLFITFILLSDAVCLKFLSTRTEYKLICWMVSVYPYGLYTLISYRKLLRTYIICSGSVVILTTIMFAMCFYKSHILNNTFSRKRLKNWMSKCLFFMHFSITLCLTIILVFFLVNRIAGNNLISSKVESYKNSSENNYTIDEHIDEILLIQETEWKKLTITKKIDVLTTLANIEAVHLGIPHNINLGTSKLDDCIAGQYSDAFYTIYIDIDHLENDEGIEVVNSLFHELRHCYQHLLVNELNKLDEDSKKLSLYDDAFTFKEEFENYEELSKDFDHYYVLKCETDARDYARITTQIYERLITDYIAAKNN